MPEGINVADLSTYSDQDLLTIYRWALANGAAGQRRSINGREMEFPPAQVIMEIIPTLELRIAAANGGTTAAARLDQPPLRRLPFPGVF